MDSTTHSAGGIFRQKMPDSWREVLDRNPLLEPLAELYLVENELLNTIRYRVFYLRMMERKASGEELTRELAAEVLATL